MPQDHSDITHLYLRGHLFDRQVINKILDVLVNDYNIFNRIVRQKVGQGAENPSDIVIAIKVSSDLEEIKGKIGEICESSETLFEWREVSY